MKFVLKIARFLVKFYFVCYFGFHLLVWWTPETVRVMIFQNNIKSPFRMYRGLDNPPNYGLNRTHNFYLDTEPTVRVGIWHFIPAPLEYEYERDKDNTIKQHFEKYFKETYDKRPVVIYIHGNDRDRSAKSRVKLCLSLNELGYHVFAIDVRGFGDSTGTPSETGAVNDVLNLYNFIKRYQREANIHLWGHSLGTGIAAHSAKILSEFQAPAPGVILEAPFFNISRATQDYYLSALFYNNGWIRGKVEEHFNTLAIHFDNANNLMKTKSEILILHAEDDWLVPIDHSKDLVKYLDEKRSKKYPAVRLIEFHKDFGLSHNKIYMHKELYPLIKDFIDNKPKPEATTN